jgi:hypothetical protein
VADAHIGRPSARLKADLAAEATTLAQSFFRHLTHTRNIHSIAAGAKSKTGGFALAPQCGGKSFGAVEPANQGESSPDPAIIHPRVPALAVAPYRKYSAYVAQ